MNQPEHHIEKPCGCKIEIDKEKIKITECNAHIWEVSKEKWQKRV